MNCIKYQPEISPETMPELSLIDVATLLNSCGVVITEITDNYIVCNFNNIDYIIALRGSHFITFKIQGRRKPSYDPIAENYQTDRHSCGYHALNYVLFGDKQPTEIIYERLERIFKTPVKNFYECGSFYTCCNRFKLQGCICENNILTEINYNNDGPCIYSVNGENPVSHNVPLPASYISIPKLEECIDISFDLYLEQD